MPYYFVVGAWLSNFCHCFTTLWAPSVQKWSLYQNGEKFLKSGKKGKRKNGGRVQREPNN